ncbi:MAG: hypothetical protein M1351_01360 [Candidatus Thermoplasmatota archaeon]|nr:hypothetical protein [Candidatus Thermoplasmatota archaeon]
MRGRGGAGRIHLALAVIAVILLFLAFSEAIGLTETVVITALVLLPVIVWVIAGSRRKGIAKMITRSVRKDLRMGHAPRYLKGKPAEPRVGRRSLIVIIAVFGLTAAIMRFALKPLFPADLKNFTTEWISFVFLSLVVLASLPFVLIPAWVKNDAGLRICDRDRLLVTAPGTNVVRFITGAGLLLSLIYLFNTPFDLFFLVMMELIIVGPSCYLAVAAFGVLMERRLTAFIEADPELNSELSLRIDFSGLQAAGQGTQAASIIHLQQEVENVELRSD